MVETQCASVIELGCTEVAAEDWNTHNLRAAVRRPFFQNVHSHNFTVIKFIPKGGRS